MADCCPLGEIPEKTPERILFQTDNFFVAPTLGPMGIEGYLLIISNQHYSGVGDIPEEHYRELREVTELTRARLKEAYGKDSFVFEHGPKVCGFRGGGCLDHAHLHVVPGAEIMNDVALDLMKRLRVENSGQFYKVERVSDFETLSDIFHRQESSYMFLQPSEEESFVTEVNYYIPSQYLRMLISLRHGSGQWNWRYFPDLETIAKTTDTLGNKF